MIGSGIASGKRALRWLGYKPDGELLCFGVVPLACAAVAPLVRVGDPLAVLAVVLVLCSGTAAAVARRRGYSLGRTAWYSVVGILALLGWSVFVTTMAAVTGAA